MGDTIIGHTTHCPLVVSRNVCMEVEVDLTARMAMLKITTDQIQYHNEFFADLLFNLITIFYLVRSRVSSFCLSACFSLPLKLKPL